MQHCSHFCSQCPFHFTVLSSSLNYSNIYPDWPPAFLEMQLLVSPIQYRIFALITQPSEKNLIWKQNFSCKPFFSEGKQVGGKKKGEKKSNQMNSQGNAFCQEHIFGVSSRWLGMRHRWLQQILWKQNYLLWSITDLILGCFFLL